MRARLARRLLVGTLCLGLTACGGGGGTGPADVAADGSATDAADAGSDVTLCRDPGPVETLVPTETVQAGEPVALTCDFTACPGFGDGEFDVVVGGNPDDYTVDGRDVTFHTTGQYEVACRYLDAAGGDPLQDPTPALVVVEPGIPAEVTTTLSLDEIPAGTQVDVTCSALDGLGNPIYGPFELAVEPAAGVQIAGTTFRPTKVGPLAVRCLVGGGFDGSPATAQVVPNVPARIYTTLGEELVAAGKSTKISCLGTDKWDNKVSDFPMAVSLPPQLELKGLNVTGTITGLYEVFCVPQENVDWALFQLHPASLTIAPAAPATMKIATVPDKSVYQVLEKVLLQVTVRDMYGNLVPEAALAPADITDADGALTDGIVETQPYNFKFLSEGIYKVTVSLAGDKSIFAQVVLHVDGTGPLLAIDYPDRGATLSGDKPSVTVTGTVSDEVTGLDSFTLDGEAVSVAQDHSFSHIVIPKHSVNFLVAEALDEGGQTTRTTRAFAWSDRFYPAQGEEEASWVPEGMRLFLAESFVDDGQHDPSQPDDLATLMELILANLDLGALIPNPVYNANNYKVFVSNVQFADPPVQLQLVDGGLKLDTGIQNFSADVEAKGSCKVLGVDMCPDVSGTLTVDNIAFYAVIEVDIEAGEPVASLAEFHLGVEGIELDLSGLGSLLDPIINGIIHVLEQDVEQALSDQLAALLPETISGLFAQFQLDENISVPAFVEGGAPSQVNLRTRYAVLDLSPTGIVMHFDVRAGALKKVTHTPLGSLGRGSCAGPDAQPFALDKEQEVAVAFGDDVLNQLLFAVWWGGALQLTLTQETLGSVEETLSGYGITEPEISLDFFLAPMLSDCNAEQVLRLAVGDLYIKATFKMLGQPISLGLFATATADAVIALEPGGEGEPDSFSLTVEDIGTFEYEIVSVTEGFEDLVPIIEELLAGEALEEALSGVAGQSFGGLSLPAIDLSGLIPGVPPGTVLQIQPSALDRLGGFTQLTGVLAP